MKTKIVASSKLAISASAAITIIARFSLLPSCNKDAGQATAPVPSPHAMVNGYPAEEPLGRSPETFTQNISDSSGKPPPVEDWKLNSDWDLSNEKQLSVVRELGKRELVEAIPALVAGMFEIRPFTLDSVSYLESYPCCAALIEIGEPAVPQIQDHFWKATSHREQMAVLFTLIEIKGTAYVADWIDGLPTSDDSSLPPDWRATLKAWVLSHAK